MTNKALSIFSGLGMVAVALTVGRAEAQPRLLSLGQLDEITAGFQFNLLGAALASGGSFSSTTTNGGGTGTYTPVAGGGYVESGVVGGTAAAFSSGGTFATAVQTSGSINGVPMIDKTVNGTVASPIGQASLGFTYVSGGTYFLP